MRTKFRFYLRTKVKSRNSPVMGWYGVRTKANRITGKIVQSNSRISIFLPRIHTAIETMSLFTHHTDDELWELMFSHTISHEYIHKVLYEQVNPKACWQFDNIAGTIERRTLPSGDGI